jgi:hypothetical protein
MKTYRLLLAAVIAFPGAVRASTTIPADAAYFWSANTGWLNGYANSTDGLSTGEFFCSGWVWSANVGWIHFGSGQPGNGWRYSNSSAADFEVNVENYASDGITVTAQLRGWAWSANAGWIAFENTGHPRLNLLTGKFIGSAWGTNLGWISLDGMVRDFRTEGIKSGPDTDGDSIPDAWEYFRAGDLSLASVNGNDADGDGVSDLEEYSADTNPFDPSENLQILSYSRQAAGSDQRHLLQWTSRPTRIYEISRSEKLINWNLVAENVPGGASGVAQKLWVEPDAARGFYSVRALLPLD